jgi:hypothetical protein
VYLSKAPLDVIFIHDLIINNRTRSNFSLSLGKSDSLSLSSEERRGGDILIANVFGSRGEGRDDKTKFSFYPYNIGFIILK